MNRILGDSFLVASQHYSRRFLSNGIVSVVGGVAQFRLTLGIVISTIYDRVLQILRMLSDGQLVGTQISLTVADLDWFTTERATVLTQTIRTIVFTVKKPPKKRKSTAAEATPLPPPPPPGASGGGAESEIEAEIAGEEGADFLQEWLEGAMDDEEVEEGGEDNEDDHGDSEEEHVEGGPVEAPKAEGEVVKAFSVALQQVIKRNTMECRSAVRNARLLAAEHSTLECRTGDISMVLTGDEHPQVSLVQWSDINTRMARTVHTKLKHGEHVITYNIPGLIKPADFSNVSRIIVKRVPAHMTRPKDLPDIMPNWVMTLLESHEASFFFWAAPADAGTKVRLVCSRIR